MKSPLLVLSKFILSSLLVCALAACVPSQRTKPMEPFRDGEYLTVEERVDAFGQRVADQINNRDIRLLQRRFSRAIHADQSLEHIDIAKEHRGDLRSVLIDDLNDFAYDFATYYGEKAVWTYLGHDKQSELYHAHYRVDSEQFSMYYVDLVIKPNSLENIYVIDVYEHTIRMMWSESLASIWNLILEDEYRKKNSTQSISKADTKAYSQYLSLIKQKKFAEANKAFYQLPKAFNSNLVILRRFTSVAAAVGDEELRAAHKLWVETLGEKNVTMIHVAHYLNTEQFEKARAAIKHMEQSVGVDAGLLLMQGNIEINAKDDKKAMHFYRQALIKDPNYFLAYWQVLSALIKQEQYDNALIVLDALVARFKFDYANLEKDKTTNSYTAFTQSTEYLQWKKQKRS